MGEELTISKILDDQVYYDAFYAFLSAEYANESLDFLAITDGPYMHKITEIVERFIRDTGGFGGETINIPHTHRQGIMDAYGRLSTASTAPSQFGAKGPGTYHQAQAGLLNAGIKRGRTSPGGQAIQDIQGWISESRKHLRGTLLQFKVNEFLKSPEYKAAKKSKRLFRFRFPKFR